jgi:RNA polymerase sigma-70 factor (ECF subfamily)
MRLGLETNSAPLDEDAPLPPQHDRALDAAVALERIYREERSKLVRFASRFTRPEEAEDVIQQAFTRFAERGIADRIEFPGAYLRQAAVNMMRTGFRVATRRSAAQHVPIDDVEIADVDPVAALEARDRLRRIEEAVGNLRPRTRQIFLARRVYGYSLTEIAQQTGLSQKGVERHMGIAIKKLGQLLSSHD